MVILKKRFEPYDENTDMSVLPHHVQSLNQFGGADLDEQWVQVLKSAAGYYLGRLYYDEDMKGYYPFDRESVEYWSTRDEAEHAFKENRYTLHMF